MLNKERRIIFAVLLAVMISASAANAARLDVNVAELINSESKEINHDSYNNILKISYDVLNSGSLEYGTRVRVDIFNGTNYTATLWSREEVLNPGERKTINLYWYGINESGTWNAAARLYRAYEIIEIGNLTETTSKGDFANTLEISNVRVYDDEITFRVKSRADAKNVVVYPIKHPRAWIFEQKEIGDIAAGSEKSASMHYETGAFREHEITLIAVSEDGRNYGIKTFAMKKEEGLGKWLGRFLDWLGV